MKNIKVIRFIFLSLIVLLSCKPVAKEKKIGIQLYSLRNDINSQGIEKVLDHVVEIGYKSVELAGYDNGLIYGMEPKDFKQVTDELGLEISSSHVVRFLSDKPEQDLAYWTKVIKHHSAIGVKYLISSTLPWWGKETYTRKEIDMACTYFNDIGKIAAEHGIRFGFHNHDHAFNIMVEGKPLYDHLLEGLDPEYVFMQMDVYWVHQAGANPVHYLTKYNGRFPILHIKDDNVIGASGKLNFEEIFNTAYQQGMEFFIVEIEQYMNSPLEDAKKSFNYLNQSAFVK